MSISLLRPNSSLCCALALACSLTLASLAAIRAASAASNRANWAPRLVGASVAGRAGVCCLSAAVIVVTYLGGTPVGG